ncbi:MAG: hypothetical protein QOJ90_520 [Actinomycetota bacterium]|jgi:hypothetical protein|nr:hypothetical protein [Actinomycetota bacterium]MDQ1641169.1 hypothetical protein [Actinomycetota bacterium]
MTISLVHHARRRVRENPLPVRVANFAGRGLRLAGWSPSLDADRLIGVARRRTGYEDLGGGDFREPLEAYVASLNDEATLTTVGRLAARSHLITLLSNRLLMQHWWAQHPEILQQPVTRPWFVTGLPRSGTTLMQHLLALDAKNRSLRFWEAAAPAPPPDARPTLEDPRIERARRSHRTLDYLAPEANRLHPVAAESPTECVSLLAHSFASLEFGAVHYVPSHVRWCLEADLLPHYEYFKQQLQLLQWRTQQERWTLKSPAHLLGLDAVLSVFPDARIIWMHRDPAAAVTSHCSLTAVLHSIGSNHVDASAIGAQWSRVWLEGVARAISVRERHGEAAFFDVAYDDLVRDPERAVDDVYAWADAALTDDARTAIRSHLAGKGRAGGEHQYQPAQFGLSAEEIRASFGGYLNRFSHVPLV